MARLKFKAETPLYTFDDQVRAWPIDKLVEILTAFDPAKPIVLFVHGRGKEPQKSLKGGTFVEGMAYHKIKLGYGVNVLMFNWDSAFRGLDIFDREVPLSHTQAGGEALIQVLHGLVKYEAQQGSRKPALLVHSMGSIVLQKAVETVHADKAKVWPEKSNLFSAVLLSQPDADDRGHASWLGKLAARETTYVTLNRDDRVLQRARDARADDVFPLGLGASDPLAAAATYIDLSNMGPLGQKDDDHEVFGKGAMNGQVHVSNFFTQVLTGKAVQLDAHNVESIERLRIYHLRSQAGAVNAPALPKAEANPAEDGNDSGG